jgi:peroxiredoxin
VVGLQPGDPFPNLKLDTSAGRVELRDRWREGPLVVMFMRHFGCPFCREHLMRMGRALPQFEAAGAELVAIFQYGAEATEAFCASRGVPFDCLGDPLREGYGEVSLGRGKRKNLYTWGVAKAWVRNAAAGNLGGRPKGADRGQMPGTFVIGTDGRVRLAHYNASSEDNPSVERVLDAVRDEPLA